MQACRFDSWYPAFQHTTFRSRIISLPEDFVAYLIEDGVYLPERSGAVRSTCSRNLPLSVEFRSIRVSRCQ